MTPFADPHVIYVLVSLAWFSLADLRDRTASGIEVFFAGAVMLGAFENPLRVGAVVLAVIGVLRAWPPFWLLPLTFHPATWVVLLLGIFYRERKVGGADWLALAGIACLFAWYVPVLLWIGVLFWQALWSRRWKGPVPALPAIFLGMLGCCFVCLSP